jgi:hypothetical protein
MLGVVDKSNIEQVKQQAHQTQNDEKSFHPETQRSPTRAAAPGGGKT